MTGLEGILIAAAAKVGAPLVKGIIERTIGGTTGVLAGRVIDVVAGTLGVEPAEIAKQPAEAVEAAVRQAEAEAPEMIALYAKGLDGQFALALAETREGALQSGWRWGWMYLLGFFWIYGLVIVPLANAAGGAIQPVELSVLMTLTTWFLSLYMGGHTLKSLGDSAIAAVKAARGAP